MKLKISLKNCYGISSLEKEFDFSNKNVFSVYASNGIMKTSFAKTFMDLSLGEEPTDKVYPDRDTKYLIQKDGSNIDEKEIFVVMPYDREYKSDNIATLLVNKTLKKKFDSEYVEIKRGKEDFLLKIKELCGFKKIEEIEVEISKVFYQGETNKFFESLERLEKEIIDGESLFPDIKYSTIFNDKTTKIIEDADFLQNIDNYVSKYNQLLEKSNFFKKGIFNHTQASDVASLLEKNGFFKAAHSVLLNGKDAVIKTKVELEKIIDEEMSQILESVELKKEFDKLDKILKKNLDLKSFREYLSNNPQIVSELINPVSFKGKLWKSYFNVLEKDLMSLLQKYKKSKTTIKEIEIKAQEERGEWYKVIDEFNKKFFVPFEMYIANKVDTMLNNGIPNVAFKFEDQEIEFKTLMGILSRGELKALYILNILFEIEVRKNTGNECVLIIDDIADSFDYKNKYAIISYLKEISEERGFFLIILTHNFDFHRSICSRLDMERKHKLNAVKSPKGIQLIEDFYQNNPLTHWIDNLDKSEMLLASVPMVRNLYDYSGKIDASKSMLSFLHIKDDTKKLTIENLKVHYSKILDSGKTDKIKATDKNYYELLLENCANIDDDKLESKIILSIAIRLLAEEFMIEKIDDNEFVQSITKNQTFKLFTKFKEIFSEDFESIKLLERVILMTPENIHLNSFMYEPILDMGIDELQTLYNELKN